MIDQPAQFFYRFIRVIEKHAVFLDKQTGKRPFANQFLQPDDFTASIVSLRITPVSP